MLSVSYPQAIAALGGVCTGGFFGAFITTKTEMISRGTQLPPVDPQARVPIIKVVTGNVLRLLLLASLIVLGALGILKLGGIDSLNANLKAIFGLSFLAGAGVGKYGRYLYWRR